jgi:hypothetical protein
MAHRTAFGLGAAVLLLVSLRSQTAEAQVFDVSRYYSARTQTLDYLLNRPTVSPYTNLARRDNSSGGATNYQNIVRPQLMARQREQLQSAYSRSLRASQVPQMRRQAAFAGATGYNGAGSGQASMFATGHPTQYMYLSHFYNPVPQRPPARPF